MKLYEVHNKFLLLFIVILYHQLLKHQFFIPIQNKIFFWPNIYKYFLLPCLYIHRSGSTSRKLRCQNKYIKGMSSLEYWQKLKCHNHCTRGIPKRDFGAYVDSLYKLNFHVIH